MNQIDQIDQIDQMNQINPTQRMEEFKGSASIGLAKIPQRSKTSKSSQA
jgi:hypothetical protein